MSTDNAKPLYRPDHALSADVGDLKMPRSGKLLDDFGHSDLDFGQWVDRMVEEGRLFRPETTDIVVVAARDDSWSVKLKDVACSTVTGSKEMLEKVETHFCDKFIRGVSDTMAREMGVDVTRLVCDNGTFCKLGVNTVFDFFNIFQNGDDIVTICHELFDGIYNACPGGGGIADAEVTTSSGAVQNGQVESSYSLNNGGDCQPDAAHNCFDQDIPHSEL